MYRIMLLMPLSLYSMEVKDFIPTNKDFQLDGLLDFNKPYLFISLGNSCWPAIGMRTYSLRNAAFPFDWLISENTHLLIKCLDKKFKYFSDKQYIEKIKQYPGSIKNIKYDFNFIHDWIPHEKLTPINCLQKYNLQLALIKNKYSRRIARFNSIKLFPGKVFFLRCSNPHNHTMETNIAKELYNALKRYFPGLNFTLILILHSTHPVKIDNIKGIKQYIIKGSEFQTDLFTHKIYLPIFKDLIGTLKI